MKEGGGCLGSGLIILTVQRLRESFLSCEGNRWSSCEGGGE